MPDTALIRVDMRNRLRKKKIQLAYLVTFQKPVLFDPMRVM